jgi:hypothetical protein
MRAAPTTIGSGASTSSALSASRDVVGPPSHRAIDFDHSGTGPTSTLQLSCLSEQRSARRTSRFPSSTMRRRRAVRSACQSRSTCCGNPTTRWGVTSLGPCSCGWGIPRATFGSRGSTSPSTSGPSHGDPARPSTGGRSRSPSSVRTSSARSRRPGWTSGGVQLGSTKRCTTCSSSSRTTTWSKIPPGNETSR